MLVESVCVRRSTACCPPWRSIGYRAVVCWRKNATMSATSQRSKTVSADLHYTEEAGLILVVEDDEALRKLIEKRLAAGGHRSVGVADGVSALAWLRRDSPDPRQPCWKARNNSPPRRQILITAKHSWQIPKSLPRSTDWLCSDIAIRVISPCPAAPF